MKRVYRKRGPFRKVVPMRSFVYKGFKITINNNKFYSWRYEYELEAVDAKHLALTEWHHKTHKLIYDATSWQTVKTAVIKAKEHVDMMQVPDRIKYATERLL